MTVGITTTNLTKRYGRNSVAALNGLSLDIKAGEIYGFLGANGAGKSTTIRLLLNFLQPTSGSARINGLDIVKDSVRIKRDVGYLAGDVALYAKTTGQDLLDYLGQLQGSVDQSYRQRLQKRFEAELDKPISSLSKGNRQKIGILQAFMHQPKVLILDEPTSGLDPLMQEAFYDSLVEARERGAAVLMSSHNLAEAQRVCDRIGIIKHGELIREQVISEAADLRGRSYQIVVAKAVDATKLQHSAALQVVSHEGSVLVVKPTGSVNDLLHALSNVTIIDLSSKELDLEDEFIGYYGDNDV